MNIRKPVLLPALVLLISCGSSSPVQPSARSKSYFEGSAFPGRITVIAEDDTGFERYRVFEKGATGYVSLRAVRATAEERAAQFCERQGFGFRTLTEQTSTGPHILGNFPRVELVFVCIPKVAAAAGSTPSEDARYMRLMNLKKLLDEGVLTQEEFETEKAKILAETPAPNQ